MQPTLIELSRRLARGETTSRALIEESLARIADPEGEGARAFLTVYAERARAEADAIDAARKKGAALPAFAGVPLSIKDLFDVEGEPTRAGSRAARRRARGARRRRDGGACAPRGLRHRRQDQHDRIRLFGAWRERALRDAAQPLGSRARTYPRRLDFRRSGQRRRRHGARDARHRHRRLVPHPGGLLRDRRLQADARPRVAEGRLSAQPRASIRSGRWRAASHVAPVLDSVLSGGGGEDEAPAPLAGLAIGVIEGYVDEWLDAIRRRGFRRRAHPPRQGGRETDAAPLARARRAAAHQSQRLNRRDRGLRRSSRPDRDERRAIRPLGASPARGRPGQERGGLYRAPGPSLAHPRRGRRARRRLRRARPADRRHRAAGARRPRRLRDVARDQSPHSCATPQSPISSTGRRSRSPVTNPAKRRSDSC